MVSIIKLIYELFGEHLWHTSALIC